MNKRTRVISATALAVVGVAILAGGFNPSLNAAGIAESSFDLTKYLVWGGAGALGVSALLFISASAE
ncbi:MAG: hypothetical protein HZB70_00010 [Candidatus Berkelbacteria bacterium]|nr:MAG: hypothetical protein HZB70_00010 [Candidatus Berkelbacteria bacterium]QQG51502.1 MAG: hypothetical protein HY845_02990 [Candidatus Berkelbacteria bacterium]